MALPYCVAGMGGLILADSLRLPDAAKSNTEKFNYLGRILVEYRAIFASRASGFTSIMDMQKSPTPIRFITVGGLITNLIQGED